MRRKISFFQEIKNYNTEKRCFIDFMIVQVTNLLPGEHLYLYLYLYLQVTHLLPENHEKNASDDYILLHPGAAQYIWFPDVYIGAQSYNMLSLCRISYGNSVIHWEFET